MSKVKRVFGTANFTKIGKGFNTSEQVSEILHILKENGINEIDTSRRYGGGRSEELLGEVTEFHTFTVSTKANPFIDKLTKKNVNIQCDQSLKALKRSSVDIYYLHRPDPSTPIEETVEAINDLYQRRRFKRFGLSNFTAEGVERIYNICKQNNYILPSVYQGNYNAITRKSEQELFPLLTKLGIHFYAYSPLAGGFLVKTSDQIKHGQDTSRFNTSTVIGQVYANLYCKQTFFSALEAFHKRCEKYHIKPAEVCFLWLLNHSLLKEGDAIILGASSIEQLMESIHDSRGIPLNADMIKALEDLWKVVQNEAPSYYI
ncbi:unnamed protein product [Adineta steineri]|uniref:NADP-dependent oxidoreductase domain-containing protein n=1 Tax=Adineta steineri TaxID=433720 RepID=A0A819LKA7_9BILA|nr:unnamed protein product [Adineta steineri]CAF3962354.1 unnamed protein product [Adineta steineri]